MARFVRLADGRFVVSGMYISLRTVFCKRVSAVSDIHLFESAKRHRADFTR
jgi:hypothetical protein